MKTKSLVARRRSPRREKPQRRRGAYVVEFAICIPVLLGSVFGFLEIARFMYVRQALDQTAYESARQAVIAGGTAADASERANELLSAYGIKDSEVVVSPQTIDDETAEVTVTIRCDFAENSWANMNFFSSGTLESSVTLDHENQAFLVPDESVNNEDLHENDEPLDT